MNKKGVTLIALTIIILVLVILASTSIYFGFRALYQTNNFRVYSNLSLLYTKVEEYSEKYNFNPLETDLPGFELTQDMRNIVTGQGLSLSSPTWRFLTEESLDELSLSRKIKEPATNILVNYETMEIIYTKGYRKADGTFIYRYSEMKEEERKSQ